MLCVFCCHQKKRAIVFSGEGGRRGGGQTAIIGGWGGDTVGTITNPPKLKEEKGYLNSGDFAVTNGGHWNMEHTRAPPSSSSSKQDIAIGDLRVELLMPQAIGLFSLRFLDTYLAESRGSY